MFSLFQLSWGEGVAEVEDVGVAEEEEGEDVASSRYSICDISCIFLVEYRTLNYHATSFSPLRKNYDSHFFSLTDI